MICCLVGGVLLVVMTRAARWGRARNGDRAHAPLAALFGFTAGVFLLELFVTVLAPLGVLRTTGGLVPRLALLAVPALVAVGSVAVGAANSLADGRGVRLLALTVAAGALAAEELDLHLLDLHDPRNVFAWVAVHLAVVAIPVAGLVAHRYAVCQSTSCGAETAVR